MPVLTQTAQVVHLDPVARLEGHLRVEVTVDFAGGRQQVVDAKIGGTLFRGIERILANRKPLDAPDISQRICGVCPVSQGLAATLALESAGGVTVSQNARVMRNLALAADCLHSHVLHFYVLSAMDYIDGPNMPPWQPSWSADKRIGGAAATDLVTHYVKALDIRRKCHEMGALFAGRLPHSPAFVPGGFTTTPRQSRIDAYRKYLAEVMAFIDGEYSDDVHALASVYSDYLNVGAGPRNLLAWGVFDLDAAGATKLLRRGMAPNAATVPQVIPFAEVRESVASSWYNGTTDNLNPAAGSAQPTYPKGAAYSWLKAPRLQSKAFEVGPLARMWVNGDYQNGISVMDRHLARWAEARKIARELSSWLDQLSPSGPVYQQFTVPNSGVGMGLTEAPRGALGHWVSISNGVISNYQIITPTCWNASPRDTTGLRGPIEQALIGTPVADISQPVEVARVIHSFDPCLGCAVHVMRPGDGGRVHRLELRG